MKLNTSGFTLIELLVVIAIMALLAAYAIPSYRQFVVESKRTDAHSSLLEIAGLYEKFYANTNAYPADLAALGLGPDFLNRDDYNIAVAAPTAPATWQIQADAIGAQLADDTPCPIIWIDNLGRKGPINSECWND